MAISSLIVAYILFWWLIFFMPLPFAIKRDENPKIGHDPGAPVNPHLKSKALITSVIALVLTFCFWLVNYLDIISITRIKF